MSTNIPTITNVVAPKGGVVHLAWDGKTLCGRGKDLAPYPGDLRVSCHACQRSPRYVFALRLIREPVS